MKLIRVFPRKTSLTPTDEHVRINCLPSLFDEADEVHISCLFSWDKERCEYLADEWSRCGFKVSLGGVAYNSPANEFVSGLYVKKGAVVTSRGCPNNCWFCNVWKREGALKLLPIQDGYILLDNNILACSETHIKAVFDMLKKQKHRPILTGGLEAKILKPWHAELLAKVAPERIFFAYDTPDDKEPLYEASRLLDVFNVTRHCRHCYLLVGYKGDTMEKAYERIKFAWSCGYMPFAMLYRDKEDTPHSRNWKLFQRQFAKPQIARSILTGKSKIAL